ncbi:flagellar basal body rod C-terminal domain-containing protein [Rhizobium oryziradicis]|uniref:Flagellar basal body rod protein n=1 Tax=Rhizobium oryziradicis TaxID=1867956 RepID=A0A1Q8ZNG1_9HYPH|nr:flagellar basal body protein [Rhizobium oryziradicis]OLP43422.1 flagellar basal body rod protein [Rhizobium oryziradicis]
MSISGITNTATLGMLAQQKRVANIASNVANVDTPGYRRLNTNLNATTPAGVSVTTTVSETPKAAPDTSNVDLLDEMTGLIGSEHAFAANAKVFETGADMWDMLMSIKKD